MVSLQPVTQSYLEEPVSCFLRPTAKNYRATSLMGVLMRTAPLMAYLAQVAQLDDMLDSDEFHGTIFAPCAEYASRHWKWFNGKIDVQQAREWVLCAVLRKPAKRVELIPALDDWVTRHPSMHRYTELEMRRTAGRLSVNGLDILKCDLLCSNGVVHVLNGLLEPGASI